MKQKNFRTKFAPLVLLMQKILFRMTLFSFLLLLSSVLFYVAGNFQRFLDSSQVLILRNTIFTAVTLFFFAVVLLATALIDSVVSRFFSWKKAVLFAFCVLCIALAAASGLAARGILAVSTAFSG